MEQRKFTDSRIFVEFLYDGIMAILSLPYHIIARSGILYFMIPPSTKVSVVVFDMAAKSVPRIAIGQRIVGRYCYEKDKWIIQAPFKLFFDERKYNIPEITD